MSKKMIFIGIIGVLALSFFVFPALTFSKQYYDQYPGSAFLPIDESYSYVRSYFQGSMYQDDTSALTFYCCPVNFNVPDGSIYFIKSIGVRYRDNLTDGYITIALKRNNLYTGNNHTVASWSSGESFASSSHLTYSQGTNPGYKLVDTKKFSYWLFVNFNKTGGGNPSSNLVIYQVRIHYGS
jgi:hypothetical protein